MSDLLAAALLLGDELAAAGQNGDATIEVDDWVMVTLRDGLPDLPARGVGADMFTYGNSATPERIQIACPFGYLIFSRRPR